jgi:hypothetical protein
VEGTDLSVGIQVAPHAKFKFDLQKIGRGDPAGQWSSVQDVRVQDNWLCYLQDKPYLTVSDGDELVVGDGSTPQLTGAVITGVESMGEGADWIVNPFEVSSWKQVSGSE